MSAKPPRARPAPHRRLTAGLCLSIGLHGGAIATGLCLGSWTRIAQSPGPVAVAQWQAAAAAEEPPAPPEEPIEVRDPQLPELELVEPRELEPLAQPLPFGLELLEAEERSEAASLPAAEVLLSRVLPRPEPVERPEPKEPPKPRTVPSSAPSADPEPLEAENPRPGYPSRAVELGLEGTVVLAVDVDAHGKVAKLRVARSTAARILEKEAMRTVRGWRFDRGPGKTEVEIVFRLEGRRR